MILNFAQQMQPTVAHYVIAIASVGLGISVPPYILHPSTVNFWIAAFWLVYWLSCGVWLFREHRKYRRTDKIIVKEKDHV